MSTQDYKFYPFISIYPDVCCLVFSRFALIQLLSYLVSRDLSSLYTVYPNNTSSLAPRAVKCIVVCKFKL